MKQEQVLDLILSISSVVLVIVFSVASFVKQDGALQQFLVLWCALPFPGIYLTRAHCHFFLLESGGGVLHMVCCERSWLMVLLVFASR